VGNRSWPLEISPIDRVSWQCRHFIRRGAYQTSKLIFSNDHVIDALAGGEASICVGVFNGKELLAEPELPETAKTLLIRLSSGH